VALTQINNEQISNAAAGNVSAGIDAGTKIQTNSITGAQLANTIAITTSGNIAAGAILTNNYLYANGQPFSGGGGSNVNYTDANVSAYLASGTANANIITTANVSGAFVLGNGSALTAIAGPNVVGNVPNADFATTATSTVTAGTVTTNAQPNITSVGTLSALDVTGNISGNYILGNGSQLTGIAASYDNTNVKTYLSAFDGNIIPSANNSFTLGNLNNQWSSVYVGANTIYFNGVPLSSNATTLFYDNKPLVSENANGEIVTTGNVTTTGNISGNFILGNGAFITGLPAAYGNADVAAYLPTYTGDLSANNVTVGTVYSPNFFGNAIVYANATGYLTNTNLFKYDPGTETLTVGAVNATGNVNAGNVVTATVSGTTGLTLQTTANANIQIQPNGSGNIVLSNTYINSVAYPAQDQDAASKAYVDNLVSTAISYHQAVVAATATDLATATGGTVTYAQPNGVGNGQGATLTTTGSFDLIDTANVQTANTRILVKDEANAAHNGIYVWSNATVITRSSDADTYGAGNVTALGLNDYFFVQSGNVNKGSAWVVDAPVGTITFGTSNIGFAQFSQSQVYSANTDAGMTLIGQQFNAKVDGVTTAFDGGGNITVKASANLITPNIGAATGVSLGLTGNVTGNYFIGNGSQLSNITGANITGTVANATYSLNANSSAFANTAFSVDVANVAGIGNVATINLNGNAATFLAGDGTWLSEVIYGNANVSEYLASGTNTANIITTGNISGDYILSNGIVTTGTSGNITGAFAVVADYFLGDGSNITNVPLATAIADGTSNVAIPVADGAVSINVGGSANIASFNQSNIVFTDGTNTAFTFDLAAKFLTMIDAADNQVGVAPTEIALNSTNGDYMTQLLSGAWSLADNIAAGLPQTYITPGFVTTYYAGNSAPVMPTNPDHLTTKAYVDEKNNIANGNSSVSIPVANGDIALAAGGANRLIVGALGLVQVTNNFQATGNITGNIGLFGTVVSNGAAMLLNQQ
jgi:hypothetical protein